MNRHINRFSCTCINEGYEGNPLKKSTSLNRKITVQGPPYIFAPFQTFLKFLPSFQRNSETNYTSIESPIIELLESGKKLGVAPFWWWPCPPDWKSTNIIKTHLEPLMIDLLPISKLLSFTTIQGFLRKYITLPQVNWLRNDESSNFNEPKKVPPFLLKLFWSLP